MPTTTITKKATPKRRLGQSGDFTRAPEEVGRLGPEPARQ
jgi:hypothetical protein